jgi:hypothetical protein
MYGRCSLRAVALIFFFGALPASFGIFSGAITGATSGALPGDTSPSPGKFTVSNHREILAFRSSIAAHPARPKLVDKVIETSATRAKAPIDTLAIRGVADFLSGHWDGGEDDTELLPRGKQSRNGRPALQSTPIRSIKPRATALRLSTTACKR